MVELVRQNLKINKERYEKIKSMILKNIDKNIQIEHVGSTVIPNMYGKNILDILIGVGNDDDFEYVAKQLNNIGFIGSEKSKTNIYMFFASKEDETKDGDIHIHLVMKNTERFNDFLVLKEYLLCNPDEAKEYSDFKKDIINKGIIDRKEYKRIKSEYVTELIARARKFVK